MPTTVHFAPFKSLFNSEQKATIFRINVTFIESGEIIDMLHAHRFQVNSSFFATRYWLNRSTEKQGFDSCVEESEQGNLWLSLDTPRPNRHGKKYFCSQINYQTGRGRRREREGDQKESQRSSVSCWIITGSIAQSAQVNCSVQDMVETQLPIKFISTFGFPQHSLLGLVDGQG